MLDAAAAELLSCMLQLLHFLLLLLLQLLLLQLLLLQLMLLLLLHWHKPR